MLLNVQQQAGHRRLHRHVRRRDRLVGDHRARVAGKGARDADALLLPSGELPRPPPRELARQLHQVEQLHDAPLDLVAVALDTELADPPGEQREIGSAACWESVCQYVSISVVALSLKKQKTETN